MSEVKQELEHLTDPSLIAFSYAFQRMEIDAQPQQLPLLISANISRTHLPQESPQHVWHIASTGTVSPVMLSMLHDATALADIDLCHRTLITPSGQNLVDIFNSDSLEEISGDMTSLQDQLGWSTPLFHQLNTLKLNQDEAEDFDSTATSTPHPNPTSISSSTLPDHESFDALNDPISQVTEDQLNPSQVTATSLYDRSLDPFPKRGHLILLVSNALESLSPRVKSYDLKSFSSITLIMNCSPDRVLSWHRWNTSLGGTMLQLDHRTHIKLADRFQRGSLGLRRVQFSLGMNSGFSVTGITQLTTQLGPLPVEGREQGGAGQLDLWAELPLSNERWSALLMIKYKGQKLSAAQLRHHTIATLSIGQYSAPLKLKVNVQPIEDIRQQRNRIQTAHISHPLGGFMATHYDQLMIGVAFAQQLSHRVRVIDNLILSLLRRDPRKPGKLLDQLVKITMTLESPRQAKLFRDLKLEFLALGELPPSRWDSVISALLRSTHRLTSEGQWLSNAHSN